MKDNFCLKILQIVPEIVVPEKKKNFVDNVKKSTAVSLKLY